MNLNHVEENQKDQPMTTKLTSHSKDRMKERCALKKSSQNRIADKAFMYGLKHSELNGSLRKWVDKLYLSHQVSNNTRLYGDKAYLFRGNSLITVIQIPNNLLKQVLKVQKRKEHSYERSK